VTSNDGRGGRRYAPYASPGRGRDALWGAVQGPIHRGEHRDMRAFVELPGVTGSLQELQKRLDQMDWISARGSASTTSNFAKSSRRRGS
jgi:hypothetical protein